MGDRLYIEATERIRIIGEVRIPKGQDLKEE